MTEAEIYAIPYVNTEIKPTKENPTFTDGIVEINPDYLDRGLILSKTYQKRYDPVKHIVVPESDTSESFEDLLFGFSTMPIRSPQDRRALVTNTTAISDDEINDNKSVIILETTRGLADPWPELIAKYDLVVIYGKPAKVSNGTLEPIETYEDFDVLHYGEHKIAYRDTVVYMGDPDEVPDCMLKLILSKFECLKVKDSVLETMSIYDLTPKLSQLEREVRSLTEHIEQIRQSLVESFKNLNKAKAQVRAYEAADLKSTRNLDIEMRDIRKIADISAAYWIPGGVCFLTNPIKWMSPDNVEYTFGRYFVEYSDLKLTMTNLDYKDGSKDHPHVNEGSPCQGDFTAILAELTAERRWYDVVTVLVKFLHSVNIADPWGRTYPRFKTTEEYNKLYGVSNEAQN
jgi:hypothetical protein